MSAPIRILHVAGSAQWAGGEVFLKNMADHLERDRFTLGILCPENGPLVGEMRRRDLPCDVLPLTPLGNPLPIWRLRSYFKMWRPDIVQSHGARSNFYSQLAAGRRWIHISTVHNSIADYPVSALRKKVYSLLDASAARGSSALAFVAEDLRRQFLEKNPGLSDKTHVIYNGVDGSVYDPEKIDRDAQFEKNKVPKIWTLGVVGRLTPQKGHVYLLEAIKRARAALPPFQLLIVGDGPLRAWLQGRIAEMGLRQVVKFLGVRQDIPEVLSMMDVVVLPSVSEGLPYAALEAMAMERVVVATLVNGTREIFKTGEEGYGIPAHDPEIIAATVLRILKNPDEARARAKNGRARVRDAFDLRKNLSQWQSLYNTLAWKRKRSL